MTSSAFFAARFRRLGAPAAPAAGTAAKERKIKYWVSPMDPGYVRDKPGKALCGMALVPVYEDEAGAAQEGTIAVDPRTLQSMGVRTAKAEMSNPDFCAVDSPEGQCSGYDLGDDDYQDLTAQMAGWMKDHELLPKVPGDQNVTSFFIVEQQQEGSQTIQDYAPPASTARMARTRAVPSARSRSTPGMPPAAPAAPIPARPVWSREYHRRHAVLLGGAISAGTGKRARWPVHNCRLDESLHNRAAESGRVLPSAPWRLTIVQSRQQKDRIRITNPV